MLISIDPSSTRTGWAVGDVGIEDAGAIKNAGKCYTERVKSTIEGLDVIMAAYPIDTAIIEIPSGKTHGRLRGRNISGLPVYGFAVGAVWLLLVSKLKVENVNTAFDNQWTHGKNKEYRKPLAAHLYPKYTKLKDSGGDISDAICLWDWFKKQQLIKGMK